MKQAFVMRFSAIRSLSELAITDRIDI